LRQESGSTFGQIARDSEAAEGSQRRSPSGPARRQIRSGVQAAARSRQRGRWWRCCWS